MEKDLVRVGVLSFHNSKESKAICNDIFFQGENPAVHGGREADNCLTFHRRLQTEYPMTANLY